MDKNCGKWDKDRRGQDEYMDLNQTCELCVASIMLFKFIYRSTKSNTEKKRSQTSVLCQSVHFPFLLSGTKIFPQPCCDWKTNQVLGWYKFIMFLFVVANGTETQCQANMIIGFGFVFVCAAWFHSGLLKWHFQFRSSSSTIMKTVGYDPLTW